MSNAEKISYEIIQIRTVRITLSIAYTKTLEIIFEAYLYIKSSDKQKTNTSGSDSGGKFTDFGRDLEGDI